MYASALEAKPIAAPGSTPTSPHQDVRADGNTRSATVSHGARQYDAETTRTGAHNQAGERNLTQREAEATTAMRRGHNTAQLVPLRSLVHRDRTRFGDEHGVVWDVVWNADLDGGSGANGTCDV